MVGFGVTGVNIATRGDIVVVFLQLRVIDDAAEFFLFLSPYQGVGDAGDALGRDEVLGVALLEGPAGINEEDFALPGFWLGFVEEQDDTWGGSVVEGNYIFKLTYRTRRPAQHSRLCRPSSQVLRALAPHSFLCHARVSRTSFGLVSGPIGAVGSFCSFSGASGSGIGSGHSSGPQNAP